MNEWSVICHRPGGATGVEKLDRFTCAFMGTIARWGHSLEESFPRFAQPPPCQGRTVTWNRGIWVPVAMLRWLSKMLRIVSLHMSFLQENWWEMMEGTRSGVLGLLNSLG